MPLYRVTRDNNRFPDAGYMYYAKGDIIEVEDITDTDGDGEVRSTTDGSLGNGWGYLMPDALVPVGLTGEPLDPKVLAAALELTDTRSITVGSFTEVYNTYVKIKEAMA